MNTTKNDELKKKIKVNAKVSANYNNFKGVITKIENNIVYIKITEDKDFEGKANLKGKTDKIHIKSFLIGEHNKTYWPYWEVTEEPIKKHTRKQP